MKGILYSWKSLLKCSHHALQWVKPIGGGHSLPENVDLDMATTSLPYTYREREPP
jgi:hypothetical protein